MPHGPRSRRDGLAVEPGARSKDRRSSLDKWMGRGAEPWTMEMHTWLRHARARAQQIELRYRHTVILG